MAVLGLLPLALWLLGALSAGTLLELARATWAGGCALAGVLLRFVDAHFAWLLGTVVVVFAILSGLLVRVGTLAGAAAHAQFDAGEPSPAATRYLARVELVAEPLAATASGLVWSGVATTFLLGVAGLVHGTAGQSLEWGPTPGRLWAVVALISPWLVALFLTPGQWLVPRSALPRNLTGDAHARYDRVFNFADLRDWSLVMVPQEHVRRYLCTFPEEVPAFLAEVAARGGHSELATRLANFPLSRTLGGCPKATRMYPTTHSAHSGASR